MRASGGAGSFLGSCLQTPPGKLRQAGRAKRELSLRLGSQGTPARSFQCYPPSRGHWVPTPRADRVRSGTRSRATAAADPCLLCTDLDGRVDEPSVPASPARRGSPTLLFYRSARRRLPTREVKHLCFADSAVLGHFPTRRLDSHSAPFGTGRAANQGREHSQGGHSWDVGED